MANDPTAIRQGHWTFNSVDQTPWTEGVEIGVSAPVVEFNELSTGWTRRDVGIKNGTLTASGFENDDGDFAAQYFDKVGDGTAYTFAARPGSGAAAVGNPEMGGSAHVASWGLSISPNNASRHTTQFAVDGAITKTTS